MGGHGGGEERAGGPKAGGGRGGQRVAGGGGRTGGSGRVCQLLRGGGPPARARGDGPGGVDAGGQLRRDLLLDVVAQHGEDLLHKRVQLLLEQQRRVLGLHLHHNEHDGLAISSCFDHKRRTEQLRYLDCSQRTACNDAAPCPGWFERKHGCTELNLTGCSRQSDSVPTCRKLPAPPPCMDASPMGEEVGEWPVRLKNDVKEPALLPKKPDLHQSQQPQTTGNVDADVFNAHILIISCPCDAQ